jgi:peptide/nickel transport system substrate-binding protein
VTGKSPNANFAHFKDADEQIDSARNETDSARQAWLWQQAQSIALSQMLAYPIQYTKQVYARSNRVNYGHSLTSVIQLYPGIDEQTTLLR